MILIRKNIQPKEEFTNITEEVISTIPSGFTGICTIYSKHTTACLGVLEPELLLKQDMHDFLERLASSNCQYRHDDIEKRSVPPDERRNGYSHLRAMLMQHSISITVIDGKLDLGTWQNVFFIECDPHPFRTDRTYNILLKEDTLEIVQ